jgi:hypothetical protein
VENRIRIVYWRDAGRTWQVTTRRAPQVASLNGQVKSDASLAVARVESFVTAVANDAQKEEGLLRRGLSRFDNDVLAATVRISSGNIEPNPLPG